MPRSTGPTATFSASTTWLQVPAEAVLKTDLGSVMSIPSSDDFGFILGKGMLLAEGSYKSHVKHVYEYKKNSGAVPIACGHGLRLEGGDEAYCEGLLDNDNGADMNQKGRLVLAMKLPLKHARGSYKEEVDREYVEASRVVEVTREPVISIGGAMHCACMSHVSHIQITFVRKTLLYV